MSNSLILGTVQFGLNYGINNSSGKPEPNQVFEILEKAADLGIKTLDTADAYGNASELIGIFFSNSQTRFDINTKFKVEKSKTIEEQLYNSLKILNTDCINVYFYHSFQEMIDFPDTLISLKKLKSKLLIRKIGVSVYDNHEFKTAIQTPEIDVIQLPFNLLDNLNQRGILLKEAKSRGKEIQVRSIFLQGLFFKKVTDLPKLLLPLAPYLNTINNISQENNITVEALALSYPLSQPTIDYVLLGVDNIEQLERNSLHAAFKPKDNVTEKINAIHVTETELLYPKNWK
jgi:aryl-alcohol dehydrogenase-like predicted oxidoreductase